MPSSESELSVDMNRWDRGAELATPKHMLELSEQQRTNDHVELAVAPSLERLRRAAGRREQRRHVDVGVENYSSHSAAGGVLLSDRDLHRLVLPHALCGRATISQNRLDPFTATQECQVALVGQNDRLGASVRTDYNRISLRAVSSEPGQHRGQFGAGLTSR
jgi:hypothetical protein